MTQEEKAKAYDEAIERAKSLLSGNQLGNAWIYKLLPELKERENDRIKTNIIKLLRFVRDTNHQYSDACNEAIDWLEKQGEQKNIDKIEPKFHAGDFITHQVLRHATMMVCLHIMNMNRQVFGSRPSKTEYNLSQSKNGRQDLDKAIHYCELAIDLDTTHVHHVIDGSINKFVKNNNLAEEFRVVLLIVDDKMYKNIIEYLSDTEYIEKIFP